MQRLLLAALLATALSASADIAVFTDGRAQKITAYEVDGDRVHLVLDGGARMDVSILRVERIVDDEIVESPEEVIAELPSLFPKRSWRYDDASGVAAPPGWEEIIRDAARKHDVDAMLVTAVIRAESNFDPRAVSRKGARGAMQLMPATASRFGVANSFDLSQNIHGGTRYLRWLLDRFDRDPERSVAAYNAGEGNVDKYDGVPPFRETVEYVKRVSRHIASIPPTASVATASGR
ncbi:MAG: lytic transglycosylase domain-containing protein [Thermoanaerobaculia bacterium]